MWSGWRAAAVAGWRAAAVAPLWRVTAALRRITWRRRATAVLWPAAVLGRAATEALRRTLVVWRWNGELRVSVGDLAEDFLSRRVPALAVLRHQAKK